MDKTRGDMLSVNEDKRQRSLRLEAQLFRRVRSTRAEPPCEAALRVIEFTAAVVPASACARAEPPCEAALRGI